MWSRIGNTVIGSRLPTAQLLEERLSNLGALAILSSDALSSVAYATEELLLILILGGSAALSWSMPITFAIVGLLILLVISYRQLIRAYPGGGGAYSVAKANFGDSLGLVSASGLLLDYVLTAAVSISAGVAALKSAFPALMLGKVELALIFLVFITVVNLRGVRETGRVFTVPTLVFVGSMAALLLVGLFRYLVLGQMHAPPVIANEDMATVSIFLLLRAFSSGCAALTGVEAISNSTSVFKNPAARNASRTLLWMGIVLATLFVGVTFLAGHTGITPLADETVLSQVAHEVFGTTPLYYLVQVSTLLILVMAANTAFSGFPRLASILSRDRYLPRQLADVGSRLVFSNGILLLAILAGVLLVTFGGNVHHLIPLYAVGVFLSFSIAQAGMVRHWVRHRGEGWIHGAVINGVSAVVTAIALSIIAITKFTHGAWLITLLVPAVLWMFSQIHKHYQLVSRSLTLEGYRPPTMPMKHVVVVPVSGVHRGVLNALAYARAISPHVRAVHIASDFPSAEDLAARWKKYVPGVPLEILYSPYRTVIRELLRYLETVQVQESSLVTVVIPEFIPVHWWEMLLHNQTATMLKLALLFRRRTIAVISVPQHLRG